MIVFTSLGIWVAETSPADSEGSYCSTRGSRLTSIFSSVAVPYRPTTPAEVVVVVVVSSVAAVVPAPVVPVAEVALETAGPIVLGAAVWPPVEPPVLEPPDCVLPVFVAPPVLLVAPCGVVVWPAAGVILTAAALAAGPAAACSAGPASRGGQIDVAGVS